MRNILIFSLSLFLPNISFANERFIPVELWSGGEITGAQEITFPETNFNFGYKKRYSIRGPINWENPRTGEIVQVYDRSRYSKKMGKTVKQLWAVTNNNQCLGRVFDNRRNKIIANGCKFPIGNWKEGEIRSFTSDYYDKERGNYKRMKIIKIMDIGDNKFSCLKFSWTMKQDESVIDENVYEYCHQKGLVKVNGGSKF